MSTAYNRRRGTSARDSRKPRQCAQIDDVHPGEMPSGSFRCIRLAPINRYCYEHQRPPVGAQPNPTRRGGHPGELSRKVRPGILERARKRWRRAYREWKAGRRA